jgi:hypothetical protein
MRFEIDAKCASPKLQRNGFFSYQPTKMALSLAQKAKHELIMKAKPIRPITIPR